MQFCGYELLILIKMNRGRPPTITGCAQDEKASNRYRPWKVVPVRFPDPDMKKKMLAEAITVAVKFVMKNCMYVFNGQVRRQAKGGPIGLALTGDVA